MRDRTRHDSACEAAPPGAEEIERPRLGFAEQRAFAIERLVVHHS
jgi:hypothetical protein